MKLPIRLRLEVTSDLSEAADWYNAQRAGLGDEFVVAAFKAMDELAERPTWFPVVHKDVRRYLMDPYPYAIYFRSERSRVSILGVIHTARSPRVWKRRSR